MLKRNYKRFLFKKNHNHIVFICKLTSILHQIYSWHNFGTLTRLCDTQIVQFSFVQVVKILQFFITVENEDREMFLQNKLICQPTALTFCLLGFIFKVQLHNQHSELTCSEIKSKVILHSDLRLIYWKKKFFLVVK